MQEQDGNSKFDISARLEELRQEHAALAWEGNFRDYFELVTQNPRLAQLSHARINDMTHAAGLEKLNEGTRDEITRYKFFSGDLFGIVDLPPPTGPIRRSMRLRTSRRCAADLKYSTMRAMGSSMPNSSEAKNL